MRYPALAAARRAAEGFFFAPASGFPFAVLRVAVAGFILLQLLWLLPAWSYLYGSEGYVEWFISNDLFRIRALLNIVDLADALGPRGFSDQQVLYGFTAVYGAAVLGLLSGWRPRLLAALTCLLHFMLNNTAIIFGYGVETFTHIGLFYLIFAPSSGYFSLVKAPPPRPSVLAGFVLRVLQLHLCVVYFNAGLAKLGGTDWRLGEAVWYTLANANYGTLPMQWLAQVPLLARLCTWWVLFIETLYPLGIWPRRTRPFWLANVLLLHAGIGLFMGLYMFGLIMIIINVVAFGQLRPAGRWWPAWARVVPLATATPEARHAGLLAAATTESRT